jgi:hypothetical protein
MSGTVTLVSPLRRVTGRRPARDQNLDGNISHLRQRLAVARSAILDQVRASLSRQQIRRRVLIGQLRAGLAEHPPDESLDLAHRLTIGQRGTRGRLDSVGTSCRWCGS